ncbi:hypothetical protein AQJ84_23825 [Streptomyces resistomycificus]|uniref:Uncharacterized protein n=1 Tax=Streptomyces resistomycificus TaxID=67356 RepID=A0A0L8LGA5_9ACTN|nr:hypothetical protein ADK37_12105 [Streptomyces resistomycificus]KUN95100.1 hypothetical protein AQJ84_23825 [Streptomyces resistomycificus]
MRAPVRPGDVLHGAMEIMEVRPRDDGTAVVRSRGTLTNGSGTLVMEVQGESLWDTGRPTGTRTGRLDHRVAGRCAGQRPR